MSGTIVVTNKPCLASIGNYVWEDINANGIQDDGNTGLNLIEVKLYKDGAYIKTTYTGNHPVTGNPGFYLFSDLEPGNYNVCFVKGSNSLSPKT